MQPEPAPAEPALYDSEAFAAETGASAAQMADLFAFEQLLVDGTGRMNLVGPSALAAFWGRHAYDSAQLLAFEPQARVWADLGAGAGFPGVVLAILLKGDGAARVHLVESVAKRCRFLDEVVRALDLPAVVHHARAESLAPPPRLDVVTARACAPMSKLLAYAWPFMRAGARGLFLKGRGAELELTEARRFWTFKADLQPSLSDPSGRVVRIERLARV